MRPDVGSPDPKSYKRSQNAQSVWSVNPMNVQIQREESPPAVAIAALIARHGLLRIMLTVLATSLRGQGRSLARSPADLPDRLRRDIGLAPERASPRYWHIRL
ncbi:MAG: hypothetical protein WBO29_12665 [Albidovulum sp.]